MALYRIQLTSFYDHDIAMAIKINNKVYNFDHGWEITEDDNRFYVGQEAKIPFDKHFPPDGPEWIASGDLIPATEDEWVQ